MVGVSEGFPCERATQLLAELREAVQCFLLRMAAIFPQRTQQLVFLINNYDIILTVLMVSQLEILSHYFKIYLKNYYNLKKRHY